MLPGFGSGGQAALGAARVLVIGAGGLGCNVLPQLAAMGVGTIGIVDDDVVDASNLHRQTLYTPGDVGAPKAARAAARLRELNPDVTVRVHLDRLTSANALALFDEYDLVVDGSDNFPTRYLADDAASLSGMPVVWGAVHQYGGQAGVAWDAEGPAYRDLFPVPPEPGTVPSCAEAGVLPSVCAVIGRRRSRFCSAGVLPMIGVCPSPDVSDFRSSRTSLARRTRSSSEPRRLLKTSWSMGFEM